MALYQQYLSIAAYSGDLILVNTDCITVQIIHNKVLFKLFIVSFDNIACSNLKPPYENTRMSFKVYHRQVSSDYKRSSEEIGISKSTTSRA